MTRYDFSKIDPRTGIPRIVEYKEDRIQLMSRMPGRSGYIRLLQNRVNLRSVGNLRLSERLYYNAYTRTLYSAPNGTEIALWHAYRLPNGQRAAGWIED